MSAVEVFTESGGAGGATGWAEERVEEDPWAVLGTLELGSGGELPTVAAACWRRAHKSAKTWTVSLVCSVD